MWVAHDFTTVTTRVSKMTELYNQFLLHILPLKTVYSCFVLSLICSFILGYLLAKWTTETKVIFRVSAEEACQLAGKMDEITRFTNKLISIKSKEISIC